VDTLPHAFARYRQPPLSTWANNLSAIWLSTSCFVWVTTQYLSQCHKSVFYWNGWKDRAGFWLLSTILHFVIRWFGYLRDQGISLWKSVPFSSRIRVEIQETAQFYSLLSPPDILPQTKGWIHPSSNSVTSLYHTYCCTSLHNTGNPHQWTLTADQSRNQPAMSGFILPSRWKSNDFSSQQWISYVDK